jgi:hypothetical protein
LADHPKSLALHLNLKRGEISSSLGLLTAKSEASLLSG